ncbi:MAG: hypothetical protein J6X31_06700 [Bacteroidales bacterium]|nr:hypothetical protein [Bacteroidales bacterium]
MKERIYMMKEDVPHQGTHLGLSHLRRTALCVLFALMLLVPQWAKAGGWDHSSWYELSDFWYNYDPNNPCIHWKTVLFNDNGADEGYYNRDFAGYGAKTYIAIGNDGWQYAGYVACNDGGYGRDHYECSVSYGGWWEHWYNEGSADGGKITWIEPIWHIPFDLLNTNISVKVEGRWTAWTSENYSWESRSASVAVPFTYTIRQINWNGDFTVSPDGTVTVPYYFTGGGNTDGRTHICTSINGGYNGTIGLKGVNLNGSSYTFTLGSIGMNMRSSFSIQPYHEYTHYRDRDAGNGTKNYCTFAGVKEFRPMPVAHIESAEFHQAERKVTIKWTADNQNYLENGGGMWAIYRNGRLTATVPQSQYSYDDTAFENEKNEVYTIYYLWKGWNTNTRLDLLKSNDVTVSTTRKVPVINLTATSLDDRIVFTWESDGYEKDWGNLFYVYIDNEKIPTDTIIPSNKQTQFQWEHRSTDRHTARLNSVEDSIHYSEEPLNACTPHNYRVDGVINDKVLNSDTINRKAIGTGTLFYSFNATKGVYPGTVKLSWHVDQQGYATSKTYILERRRAEKEKEAWVTLYRTASADDYLFYTDDTPLPGEYYEYRVTVFDKCSDGEEVSNETKDIGFAQTTGTMSGRITFGSTGSSVANVDVIARKTGSSGNESEQFYAKRFTDVEGMVKWEYPSVKYINDRLNTGDFSIQMWVNPDSLTNAKMLRLNGETCALGMNALGQLVLTNGTDIYTFEEAALTAGRYNHVVLTRSGQTLKCYVDNKNEAGEVILASSQQTLNDSLLLEGATQMTLGHFKGYVDEFRIWLKALTESEILENYDHLLVGNEKYLETYWTFDEGLKSQFFDYSRDGTVYHGHHGRASSNVQASTLTAERLQLKAKTDRDGNYIIQGVPFSGEGTTYAVIPSLGIHQFNPTQQLRYVGNNSLVHNGTDYTDISSFPVRGKIRYAGTDYPVEGVQFFVDGQICAKEGEPITSNAYGEYEISVPIGSHYITISKQGHEFADGGRYPADPNKTGLLRSFNDAVSNLDFEDVTLVPVVGRITGGSIEEAKPLGFGESKNNIGQAIFTLGIDLYRLNVKRVVEGTTVDYKDNTENLPVASPTLDVQSTAYRQGGNSDETKKIVIQTDPLTGEFAALLPPLEYRVESIVIPSNKEITFETLPVINATDPTQVYTDTLTLEDGTERTFDYVAKMVETYNVEPVLEIAQADRKDGSFGDKTYAYSDRWTPEVKIPLYSVDEKGVVDYAFGYPLFKQQTKYTFNVRGYETYTNYDDPQNIVVDEVPLQNVTVTFTNQMGAGQQVVINADLTEDANDKRGDLAGTTPDAVLLNKKGEAKYEWMAGLPNITSPYTLAMTATFMQNGRTYTWKGANAENSLTGIVTGALPSGNNFVTSGPDYVSMILRDPAGTNSQAYWEAGTTLSNTVTTSNSVNTEFEAMTHTEFGVELTTFTGAGIGAFAGVITTNKTTETLDVGVSTEVECVSADTKSISVTTNKRVTTSDQPEYVGAQGDVFIGNATNIIFGNARSVCLTKDSTGTYSIAAKDNYVTDQSFGTMFHYTQNYIENTLIPNLINLRNDILRKGVDQEGLLYDTDLTEDDENYGADSTYTCTKPENVKKEIYTDMVGYYNQQIANWENWMAFNERMKVKAIDNRRKYLDSNQSFDTGTFIEASTSRTESNTTTISANFNTKLIFGYGTDVEIFGQDVNVNLQETLSYGNSTEDEYGEERTVTTGYALVEAGDDDALSVDVYHAPDGMGAIFVTRGGQTTCPYEGEQRTKYFEPGEHVLAAATMQIEVPKIAVENAANRLGGVPAGKKASYNLLLTNESETEEDCYFSLLAIDETNKKGAKLSINGDPFSNGRLVLVPAGGTVRMNLQLEQNAKGDLAYDSIAIVLASSCQSDPSSTWDVIGDTVYISAEFVPTSTDVALRIDNAVVNTLTKGALALSVRDYDPNYEGLKYIAVQYQGVGETYWHDARKYVMKESDIQNPNEEVLPTSGIINLNFDMTNSAIYPDRTYKFRALSARSYGKGEVTNVSDEILVVKDMSRPKPLGQPNPTDGVLSVGDEMSVLFNETILNGELMKDANFRITGILNGSVLAHHTALQVAAGNEAAKTASDINLGSKDFSLDLWMKADSIGELLSHGKGTEKLTLGINADHQLTIAIGAETYTSVKTMPMHQWAFFTMSLSKEGKLNASVATDATTTTLFSDKETKSYFGNGPIVVGTKQGARFAMHELLLWDEVHNMTTALQQRSIRKSPATHGLIGYWKMDEGEGKSLTDYARNRHMTMAAETWYLENENKAIRLSGEQYLAIPTSTIVPQQHDDYAIELWMKSTTPSADAQLLQMGHVGLVLTAEGQLRLDSVNTQVAEVKSPLCDNNWHHVALSVLRNGNASLCVDGEVKASVSADKLGDLASDQLLIGARRTWQDQQYQYDRPLDVTIDEVRLWNATMHTSLLKRQRKMRLTGTEPGLVAYYPFEVKTLDAQNQIITLGSASDLCSNSTLTLDESQFIEDAPALRVKPEEENVNFTFTASDNKIVIALNEESARVEGTTLNVTVRDVHDKNGNLSEPITWSVYVNQNPLAWSETALNVTQQVTEESQLDVVLSNKSGQEQTWTLGGLPQWLTADVDYGLLMPLGEQAIHFTVSEATPIGKYEVAAYAVGNDGIETPLTLNVTVTGNLPEWSVNMYDYETSMNIIGQVKLGDQFLSDADDIIAAFIGEECRGVAHLEYNERYGSYYFTMDVYGESFETGKEVTFRAYDASTGIIYPVVTLESNRKCIFVPLTLQGNYAEPSLFYIQNKIEQRLNLKTGWNWISFNVQADDMTIPALFQEVKGDVKTVKSQTQFLSPAEDSWSGSMHSNVSTTEMYSVMMTADRTLRVVGTAANQPVILQQGWNWLGYQAQQVASLGDALADMEKLDGDMIKAQSGVAYWDIYDWSGSLLLMQPGLGYQLKQKSIAQTFSYPGTTATEENLAPSLRLSQSETATRNFAPIDFHLYPDNAILSAKVMVNGKVAGSAELGVFVGEECRTAAMTDAEGIAYLNIPGDEDCELNFKVAVDGQILEAALTLTYETDAIYGTPEHPVLIEVGNTSGIVDLENGSADETAFDLTGRKVSTDESGRGKLHKGVYIINGQKQTVK